MFLNILNTEMVCFPKSDWQSHGFSSMTHLKMIRCTRNKQKVSILNCKFGGRGVEFTSYKWIILSGLSLGLVRPLDHYIDQVLQVLIVYLVFKLVGQKITENSEFVVSELVVGSGEQDMYITFLDWTFAFFGRKSKTRPQEMYLDMKISKMASYFKICGTYTLLLDEGLRTLKMYLKKIA